MVEDDTTKLELFRGDEFLGTITLAPTECDFPWSVGYLEVSNNYGNVKALFETEIKASRKAIETDEDEAINNSNEALMKIMGPGIRLKDSIKNKWVSVIGISIDGNRVSWR